MKAVKTIRMTNAGYMVRQTNVKFTDCNSDWNLLNQIYEFDTPENCVTYPPLTYYN